MWNMRLGMLFRSFHVNCRNYISLSYAPGYEPLLKKGFLFAVVQQPQNVKTSRLQKREQICNGGQCVFV